VPLDKKGKIRDDKRIKAALPTIQYLIKKNAMVVLIAHLGRPNGKVDEKLRMDAVAERLEKLLKRRVFKLDDCIGHSVDNFIDGLFPGDVVLLENLRFYEGEKKNSALFAQGLAGPCQLYVNDAFGTCHRSHASVDAITRYLPGCAGLLVEAEIEKMGPVLKKPKKPFIAVMGGVKVSGKIDAINNLLKKVDKLLIGGAMMFTFLKAKGYDIDNSIVEEDRVNLAKSLLKSKKIVLPVDCIVGKKFEKNTSAKTVDIKKIEGIGLDIGPKTVGLYESILKNAKTIVWNGPMGKFEWPKFAAGTSKIAMAIANSKATTIIGGGDSAEAVSNLNLEKKITHISTGGGASLDFFAGKKLPALVALEKNRKKFKSRVKRL
jgi:3-phosphoglycerate kinase